MVNRHHRTVLATEAARRALQDAGIEGSELDQIIVGTVTGDRIFPSTACLLQDNLGAVKAHAFDVSAACAGFLYGLSLGVNAVRSQAAKTVLVVGVETLSKIVNWTDRNTCVLFGDGAGAVLVGESPDPERGILSLKLHADGSGAYDLWLPAPASRHIPRLTPEMMEKGLHFPKMNGKAVFRWATEKMPEVAEEVLRDAGMTIGDVDLTGFSVEAADGGIGKVDEATYEVGGSFLVVDTGPWIFGKKVLLPAGLVNRVDPGAETILVHATKDEIKNAPEYDPDNHEDYRRRTGDYYTESYRAMPPIL